MSALRDFCDELGDAPPDDSSSQSSDDSATTTQPVSDCQDEAQVCQDDPGATQDESQVCEDDSETSQDESQVCQDDDADAEDETQVCQQDPELTQGDPQVCQDGSDESEDDAQVCQDEPEDTQDQPQVCQEDPEDSQDQPQVCQEPDDTPSDPQVCEQPTDDPSQTPAPAEDEKKPDQKQQEEADFEKLLAQREGGGPDDPKHRYTVYKDSKGIPTVGIGHKVMPGDGLQVGSKITEEQAADFFKKDSADAMSAARAQAAEAGITDSAFIPYLASVNFQLGTGWNSDFKKTWQLIVDGKYEDAAQEAAKSKWAKQTPVRLKDFQDALRKLPPKS